MNNIKNVHTLDPVILLLEFLFSENNQRLRMMEERHVGRMTS